MASLSFPDGSFDLLVSTLSMHHWADPSAGMAEIARVLRPVGRALVWDTRPGAVPFHRDVRDSLEPTREAPLRLISATPWRWPLGLTLTQRLELVERAFLAGQAPASTDPAHDHRGDRLLRLRALVSLALTWVLGQP